MAPYSINEIAYAKSYGIAIILVAAASVLGHPVPLAHQMACIAPVVAKVLDAIVAVDESSPSRICQHKENPTLLVVSGTGGASESGNRIQSTLLIFRELPRSTRFRLLCESFKAWTCNEESKSQRNFECDEKSGRNDRRRWPGPRSS